MSEIWQCYYLWFLRKFQGSGVDRRFTGVKWTMKDGGIGGELLLWVFTGMKRKKVEGESWGTIYLELENL